jgi:hypothetical protein
MPSRFHATATLLLSAAMVVLGVVLAVRSLVAGGGPAAQGVLIGMLFAAAGGGRLWLSLRRS